MLRGSYLQHIIWDRH